MAGTTYSEVFDNFMMKVSDYKLTILFNASQEDFETYLTAFLNDAIVEFSPICDQSLTSTNSEFSETLSQKNIQMLALLMSVSWLRKEVNTLREMQQRVQDNDFKVYSEANHMREKQAKYSALLEEVSQAKTKYTLTNNDLWSKWINNGNFFVV